MEKDIKNSLMNATWALSADGVNEDIARHWADNLMATILWQRYLYWHARLNFPKEIKTIELGCGYGKLSMALALSGARTTLLDYNAQVLNAACKAHKFLGFSPELLMQDILDIDHKYHGKFDMVCSSGTLEHFSGKNRLAAFKAHADLLRPGGLLFFNVPNRAAIFYRVAFVLRKAAGFYPKDFFEEPFSAAELRQIAGKVGIKALEVESIGYMREDFSYWIGNNMRSLTRKLFHLPAVAAGYPAMKGKRNYFDRNFTYTLLFVGVKE